MAVGLKPPQFLPPVDGIRLGCARAIKSRSRDDLTAVEIAPGAAVAGVFTRNLYPAPPVEVCREHLRAGGGNIRGLVINAGIANAGTLGRGLRDARESCKLFAAILGCRAAEVLPLSTGVIMEYLPMEKYAAGLRSCARRLAADNWLSAARAMTTTDTVAKGAYRKVQDGGRVFTVAGIAKGSGMIHPNMGTMLAFVATDAAVSPRSLAAWQREAAAETFNAVSVDGDTSTNDSFILAATGRAGKCRGEAARRVRRAVAEVCAELAEAIVRDGEGATKLVVICARGAKTRAVCRKVAAAVAISPLVKTALAAGDANVGRFLMAVGNGGGGFDPRRMRMQICGLPVIRGGGLDPHYDEKKTAAALAADEIRIDISLGDGAHSATMKTCDLTRRYIEINADYRS
ncbi:MAG: bifunctional glutamate N-acetyltransferase/amino-acid acetyltransferase ArgJ [Gammaproteobacteria bacterium]